MTNQKSSMSIKLANPRGFCAGVDRAIDIVDHSIYYLVLLLFSLIVVLPFLWLSDRLEDNRIILLFMISMIRLVNM